MSKLTRDQSFEVNELVDKIFQHIISSGFDLNKLELIS